jgi:hypothetical protein
VEKDVADWELAGGGARVKSRGSIVLSPGFQVAATGLEVVGAQDPPLDFPREDAWGGILANSVIMGLYTCVRNA